MAPGYEPLTITGSEILSQQLSLQNAVLEPIYPEEPPDVVAIPDHTLYGEYPPKIAEDEIKPVNVSGDIYVTWPYAPLVANILAIQSFTMNRIYTEWYRNHHQFVVPGTSFSMSRI